VYIQCPEYLENLDSLVSWKEHEAKAVVYTQTFKSTGLVVSYAEQIFI